LPPVIFFKLPVVKHLTQQHILLLRAVVVVEDKAAVVAVLEVC
jgi:hypothetical protein